MSAFFRLIYFFIYQSKEGMEGEMGLLLTHQNWVQTTISDKNVVCTLFFVIDRDISDTQQSNIGENL